MLNKELVASREVNMSKYVQSVNGVTPDDSGNVNLNINAYPTISTPNVKNYSVYAPDDGTWFCFGEVWSGDSGESGGSQSTFIRTAAAGGSRIAKYTYTGNNTSQGNTVVCIRIA